MFFSEAIEWEKKYRQLDIESDDKNERIQELEEHLDLARQEHRFCSNVVGDLEKALVNDQSLNFKNQKPFGSLFPNGEINPLCIAPCVEKIGSERREDKTVGVQNEPYRGAKLLPTKTCFEGLFGLFECYKIYVISNSTFDF